MQFCVAVLEHCIKLKHKNDEVRDSCFTLCFFLLWCARSKKDALIAQLDRVQVSEACGVGSSPAERTIYLSYKTEK